jgi:4-aminobutyrate aminotransferase/(S)-3-amino-2-methylpropionate transaminase
MLANDHGALLIFDEIQSGIGRTGKFFCYEHYGVEADLVCCGKGITSCLPLSAVLGPAELLDLPDSGPGMAGPHARLRPVPQP